MKTLRDETRKQMQGAIHFAPNAAAYREWQHGYDDAMKPYGDWRVVEGVLHGVGHGGGVHIHPSTGPNSHSGSDVCIGNPGDTVKLIIPPEEEAVDDRHRALIQECKRHETRADRYEKALRDVEQKAEREFVVSLFREEISRIAKEALCDCE